MNKEFFSRNGRVAWVMNKRAIEKRSDRLQDISDFIRRKVLGREDANANGWRQGFWGGCARRVQDRVRRVWQQIPRR